MQNAITLGLTQNFEAKLKPSSTDTTGGARGKGRAAADAST